MKASRKRIFRQSKGEILQKAYSRGRKGLILTLVFMVLLVPLILLNGTSEVFQVLLVVDSVLIVVTIIVSLVIHELGVAKFKKLLRAEQSAPQEPLGRFNTLQQNLRTSETVPGSPRHQITQDSGIRSITNEKNPEELKIQKFVVPLLTEEEVSSEFYAQRRELLWELAQKAYKEGEWDNLVYHLKGAVSSALKEMYVELTGKAVPEKVLQVAEFVCKQTGLEIGKFQKFFERTKKPQKKPETEPSILFEHAQELLTDLQSSVPATNAPKVDVSVEKCEVEDQKEPPKKSLQDSKNVSAPLSEKSSKVAKKSGKRGKSGKDESVNGESEPKVLKAPPLRETELKKFFDSQSGKAGSPVFVVVTQSPDVINTVETLKTKYPDVPIRTFERTVDGKARIIVSRGGAITDNIEYESPLQLEKLIRKQLLLLQTVRNID